MKHRLVQRGRQSATTFVEMLCGLAVLALVFTVFLPMLVPQRTHCKAARISCVNNLKQVGLAFRIYANDHNDLYPMQVTEREGGAREAIARGDVSRIFLVMSNELSVLKTVICPADTREPAADWNAFGRSSVSYFVGVDATNSRPDMLLSGDRNVSLNGNLLAGLFDLGTHSPVAWTPAIHKNAGNLGLADGSVQQETTASLKVQLANSSDPTNRVLFPQ